MGGIVVATGTPEDVAATPGSHTGEFRADLLADTAPKVKRTGAKRKPRAKKS